MSLLVYLYLFVLVTASITCLLGLPQAPLTSKIIAAIILLTTITELIGFAFYLSGASNRLVFTIFNPLQLFLTSIYFNFSIEWLKKKHLGMIVGISGIMIGVANFFAWPAKENTNTYFLLFESVCVITLCLYSFYTLLLDDDNLKLVKHPHFWYTVVFFFFWFVSFLYWGLRDVIATNVPLRLKTAGQVLLVVNIVSYSALAYIFHFSIRGQNQK